LERRRREAVSHPSHALRLAEVVGLVKTKTAIKSTGNMVFIRFFMIFWILDFLLNNDFYSLHLSIVDEAGKVNT